MPIADHPMIACCRPLRAWITCRIHDERAANLVEYGLLVVLIAVACLSAVTAFGSSTSQKFSEIDSSIG